MPGKSKAADTASHLSEDAIRQRAYFLWEKDGRPAGRDQHYWQLAHQEATQAMVEETTTRTARATGGKNPSDIPDAVMAGNRSSKAKVKAAEAAKPVKAKPAEAKAPKKATPKPRAAIQKLH